MRALTTEASKIIQELKVAGDPAGVKGMARFRIKTDKAFGVNVPTIRSMAKKIGKNHRLALDLWASGYHEAKLLASMVDDAKSVTEKQMEDWAGDFDSWDVVDQCCGNLFDKTSFAVSKAVEWSERREEFVKRAGFSLMAYLAVHDKKAPDRTFQDFLPIIARESSDERNFVRKAVNWALRQIGKRNPALNRTAISTAKTISLQPSKSAKWVASDALRELTGEAVREKLS